MSTLTPVLEADPQNPDKRLRWVKVAVEEATFVDLHLMAAESRMRITPYLRRYLSEARPYPVPTGTDEVRSFSSASSRG